MLKAPVTDKPPYIASQRILLLDEDVDDPQRFLRPEAFRTARSNSVKQGEPGRADPDADRWCEVDRTALFLDGEIQRLCVTTDAGIGKSTALRWAEQRIGRSSGDQSCLAIYIELSELPDARDEHSLPVFLSALLKRLRRAPGNEHLDEQTGHRLLRRLLAQGRLALLVDGLDQIRVHQGEQIHPKIRSLKEFLAIDGKKCRVVVAGRPHAVDRYWDDLFANGDWRFAQIDHFNKDEQRRYLGEDRFERLQRLDVEILSVPRALQTTRRIASSRLASLRTASDVYWECVKTMLEAGLKAGAVRDTDFQIPEALWLLSAMAFAMVRDGNFEGVAEGPFTAFRKRLWDERGSHSDFDGFSGLKQNLNCLGQTNEILDHGFLEGWGLKQVFWRNRSLQEFFAALWLSKFAPSEDSRWMGERPYLNPGSLAEKHEENADLYWVWRFAAEMPEDGRDDKVWVESMEPLYAPGNGTVEGTRRSNEMVYRSWLSMKSTGGPDLETLYREKCLGPFQAEFEEEIRSGKRDEKLADGLDRAAIAERFLLEFRPVPPQYRSKADLQFKMGDHLHDASIPKPFKLACYPVTNEQYELFDPGHRKLRDRRSSEDGCPVIYVDWYDAWCFCVWLGPGYRLPTEEEWEFACRAGSTTAYYFGDNEIELADYAWYDDNRRAGRTHPVGKKQANTWELHDMHGNVIEWCDSWYDEPGLFRVCRGGSWSLDAWFCRSAHRIRSAPADRGFNVGFRVALAGIR